MSRRVHHVESLVADEHLLAVVEVAGPTRVVGVGVQRCVEGVQHRIELGDVVAVLVGQHDGVETVGVLPDDVDDPVHRTRVDEHRSVALDEIRVAGERLRVRCHVGYVHTRRWRAAVLMLAASSPSAYHLQSCNTYPRVAMGFGSYDESEQESQQIDTDIEEPDQSTLPTHDGEVEFEYDDASSEDLLETFEEIKGH